MADITSTIKAGDLVIRFADNEKYLYPNRSYFILDVNHRCNGLRSIQAIVIKPNGKIMIVSVDYGGLLFGIKNNQYKLLSM
jgi:hypothetical protein